MRKRKTEEVEVRSKASSKWIIGIIQILVIILVFAGLVVLGILLFRKTVLERHFFQKTGYACTIEKFDLKPDKAMIELHDVTIWNLDPYPRLPLAQLKRVRLEWDPRDSGQFPKKLSLLEIDIERITLIRLDGNRFNVIEFVEAIVEAWGKGSGPTQLAINECRIRWDYIVTRDQENRRDKRMELLMDYEGHHENVTSIRQITQPPMQLARDKVEGFYFFNYFGDSIKGLWN